MGNLSSHRQKCQDDKVKQQDGPKHWQVQGGERGASQSNDNGPSGVVPKPKLGQSPHKWAEFVIPAGGQGGFGLKGRVVGKFSGVVARGEKEEKRVQQIYSQRICNYIEALVCDNS
jgi:hypothetical protein